MVELEVLVGEHRAIDGFAAGSVEVGEIASLDHELRDDPVERGSLVVERLRGLANAFLPCIPREVEVLPFTIQTDLYSVFKDSF